MIYYPITQIFTYWLHSFLFYTLFNYQFQCNLLYKAEGHYNQRARQGKKSSIIQSEFEHYVNSHTSATLAQIGSNFDMTGRSMHYYMKKFGFSYKKKSLATWKQRNANENNR